MDRQKRPLFFVVPTLHGPAAVAAGGLIVVADTGNAEKNRQLAVSVQAAVRTSVEKHLPKA